MPKLTASRKGTLLWCLTTVLVPSSHAQFVQQGNKLVGNDSVGIPAQGFSVAVSGDGSTAIVGGENDNNSVGATWLFVRFNGVWTQPAHKLVGTGATGTANQGTAVAVSADGNTFLTGGIHDSNSVGATWVFVRHPTFLFQQAKLVGTGGIGASQQGSSVAISADGNTAIVGGAGDNNSVGAAWMFTRDGSGTWTQQGPKLVGSGAVGSSSQGGGVAISADGDTAMVGGFGDNNFTGAAWVFTRTNGVWSQQGLKLVGAGTVSNALQGVSVALSADGSTALVGGVGDNRNAGAAWVFTRANGVWSQQGSKLVGTDAVGAASQGQSVSLTADGNTAIVGGPFDNNKAGAVWVFNRSGGSWSQQGAKLAGSGAVTGVTGQAEQGTAVSVSADGSTFLSGGFYDKGTTGATWVFTQPVGPGTVPVGTSPGSGSGLNETMTFTFGDVRGYQDLDVVNILINNFLDGRQSCYIAYNPALNVLYLENDAGSGLLPGLVLNGTSGVGNNQCTVRGAGSSATASGYNLTLTLNMGFPGRFAGNKVIYLAARDLEGGNSGWHAQGAWNVPGASTFPAVTSVSPARNSVSAGANQVLTFVFTDTKGFADLGVVNILINNFLDGRQSCYLAYSQPFNTLYLVSDPGTALLPGLALNQNVGSTANSQCTVTAAGSSAAVSGNTLTLVLNMSFTKQFAGDSVIYAAARDSTDANNSGWQSMGSITVN